MECLSGSVRKALTVASRAVQCFPFKHCLVYTLIRTHMSISHYSIASQHIHLHVHVQDFHPSPQFSGLGIQVCLAIYNYMHVYIIYKLYICLFVWATVEWVTLPFFLFFLLLKLVCYAHTYNRRVEVACTY